MIYPLYCAKFVQTVVLNNFIISVFVCKRHTGVILAGNVIAIPLW